MGDPLNYQTAFHAWRTASEIWQKVPPGTHDMNVRLPLLSQIKKQQIQLDKLAETLKQVQSPRFGSSTGVATVTGGTSSKGNTVPFSKLKEIPCKFIGTEKGCWKGDKCFFSHDSAGASGKASYDNSNIYCYVCGVPGHTASRCEHKKKRLEDR